MTRDEFGSLDDAGKWLALTRAIEALNQCDSIAIFRERDYHHERETGENVAQWEVSGNYAAVEGKDRDLRWALIVAGEIATATTEKEFKRRAELRTAALAKLTTEDRAILGLT